MTCLHCAVWIRLWLLLGPGLAAGFGDEHEPIPDKVGAEVHLAKQERTWLKKLECPICKAVLSEMHVEVIKHGMTQKGVGSEEHVWETSNAMCLALLQKYKLELPYPGGPKEPELVKKAEDEDEMGAPQGVDQAQFMRSMLVLKMGCQRWLEDYGGETSGFIFKSVKESVHSSAGAAAQDFCVRSVGLCGKGKKERRKKEKAEEKERLQKRAKMVDTQEKEFDKKQADDPMSALPEDSKLGLQRMLEMARDDPLHYMEDDAKARIEKARKDLQCDVCHAVLQDAYSEISKQPKSLRSEHDILALVEKGCEGGPDRSVPSYFGVEPPPLPPLWTDRLRPKLEKEQNLYKLGPFPKKAAKKRNKWRKISATGQQKPPPAGEGEHDLMMTMACKDMLEPERLSQNLFAEMSKCGAASSTSCEPIAAAARAACLSAERHACSFKGMPATSKQEL